MNTTITAPSDNNGRPQKVSVRVTRNAQGKCEVKTKHHIPPFPQIVRYLNKEATKQLHDSGIYIERSTNLAYAMDCCREIKAKDWSAAIAKAVADSLSDRATVETELIATTGPAYLSMGNALFELNAIEHIITGEKALPALRRKVISEAKDEGERITATATEKAIRIVAEARTEQNRINNGLINARSEISRIRAEATQSGVLPKWIRDDSHLFISYQQIYDMGINSYINQMIVHFDCTITIKSFYHSPYPDPMPTGLTDDELERTTTKRIWKIQRPVPIKTKLTVGISSLDSSFGKETIGLSILSSKGNWMFPHIGVGRACMLLGDIPLTINSIVDLNKLRDGVSRTMEQVNLDSLMFQPEQWHPSIRRKMPAALKKWFADNPVHVGRDYRELKNIPCDETIEPTQHPLDMTVDPDPLPQAIPQPLTDEQFAEIDEQEEDI